MKSRSVATLLAAMALLPLQQVTYGVEATARESAAHGLTTNRASNVTPSYATAANAYFAYPKVEDAHGVIAPWYEGQNGQPDFRLRVAAETLKRYPWHSGNGVIGPAPEFLYRGRWEIAADGEITIPPPGRPWDNGDLAQRASILINALIGYYAYSGDPACVGMVDKLADHLAHHCSVTAYPNWPNVLVSVPVAGKIYGDCDPQGYVQLDIVAEAGLALVRAYQFAGKQAWLDYARHLADLFAENADLASPDCPWPRYANPQTVKWGTRPGGNVMTGGVVYVLRLFEELMRMGDPGKNNSYANAHAAGLAYLQRLVQTAWFKNPSLGYNYWDWVSPVSNNNIVNWMTEYIMDHPEWFPDWRQHVQNILTIHLSRTCVNPERQAGVYSGAWAYSESAGCCGDAVSYAPQRMASTYLRLAALTGDSWAREMGRRQLLLSTYDALDSGVVIDGIFSHKPVTAGKWFKIAVAVPLKFVLSAMSWYPAALAPNRENHLLRSQSVVKSIVYDGGRIAYETFAAPNKAIDVLRLAFVPKSIQARNQPLKLRADLEDNGYTVEKLACGDAIVSVRHDGQTQVVIEGDDPQVAVDDAKLDFSGDWTAVASPESFGRTEHEGSRSGASFTFQFVGNQVRLIGRAAPQGGQADAFIDGKQQLAGVDCWCPQTKEQQVIFSKSGLPQGAHSLKLVLKGRGNPVAQGASVFIDAIQFSAAQGNSGFGSGDGPDYCQRVILGYPGSSYRDRSGSVWRPFSEVVARLGGNLDPVETTWWREPRSQDIANARDPELYRYGMHAADFTAYFTVAPGKYDVRVRFAESRQGLQPVDRAFHVCVNGKRAASYLDVAKSAGGFNTAYDLDIGGVVPQNGVIAIQFSGATPGKEAIAQAIEVCPSAK